MRSRLDWRQRVTAILDEFEAGVRAQDLTLTAVAKEAGISRQTLWRAKPLCEKYEQIRARGRNKSAASSAGSRIQALQREVRRLELENGRLLENIVQMAIRLRDAGLDARIFLGQAADTPELAANEIVVPHRARPGGRN